MFEFVYLVKRPVKPGAKGSGILNQPETPSLCRPRTEEDFTIRGTEWSKFGCRWVQGLGFGVRDLKAHRTVSS